MCPLLLYVYQNGGPLKSELTECFVKARHRFLYMGANLTGDRCWGLGEPRLAGETCQLQMVFVMSYVQFSSVAQSCLTLCKPMDCIMPGLPVLHQLLKPAQTHVHWVRDAIQPSHPLLSPFPPAFNLSQLQGIFQWVSSSHQMAKLLEFQLQHQSFRWILRTDFL